jgi:hypothetical protein
VKSPWTGDEDYFFVSGRCTRSELIEVNPDAFSSGDPFLTRMNDPQLLPALRQIIDLLESSNARFVGMEQLDED